jgi:glycosyltransferase involved in cell wall biosynthesis
VRFISYIGFFIALLMLSRPPRLAVLSTHPIQYYAPYFRQLAAGDVLNIHVFYEWRGALDDSYDPGFGQSVTWDVPLLDGYDHTFLENTSDDPGTHHFSGITNPHAVSAIGAYKPDAILIYGWNYRTHLRVLRHFHGRVPVFFRGDSTLIDEAGGPRTWLRRLVLRWVYRHVDTALYVGQNNRAYYEAHGLKDDQLVWVPHAIENKRFADPNGAHSTRAMNWRRELGIPTGAPTAVFAGKLSRKKAPGLLLDSFRKLKHPDAHLVIAGSGPLEQRLRNNAPSNVHFVGFQNQSAMPAVYRIGDVFALPSRGPGETWGLAINEAMASGRAVIASNRVGCAPDLIDEGKNGFVFSSENVIALKNALSAVLGNQKKGARMGAISKEKIQEWSIPEAAQRTERAVSRRLTHSMA